MKKNLPLLLLFPMAALLVPSQTFSQQSCKGFQTHSQGAWGAKANGNNAGVYRDKNFAGAFPHGLTIGCRNKLVLTSSKAVEDFLPSGSTPRPLPPGTLTNPGGSYRNVFAGQLVAAVLNVGFDLYDPDFSSNTIHLGDLVIVSGKFAGWTINQLIAESNRVIGGCSTSYKPSDLNDALDNFNNNYENDGEGDDDGHHDGDHGDDRHGDHGNNGNHNGNNGNHNGNNGNHNGNNNGNHHGDGDGDGDDDDDDGDGDGGFTTCPPCGFVINGVATQTGTQCYQLTGTDFHTAGSVFCNTPIDLNKNFQINASFNFGSNDDGGDGIAFVLQNEGPTYIGNSGAGVGYHRFDGRNICMPVDSPGPVPSFISEFDTYENHDIDCEDIGDPPADHIGFMSKSDAYHTSQHALAPPQEFEANVEDGQNHDVSFNWNAATKTMTVNLVVSVNPLIKQTFKYTGNIVNTLFQGNSSVYFGFTASNGGTDPNQHSVCIKSSCTPQSGIVNSQTDIFSENVQDVRNSLTVQPNPSSGQFNIRFDGSNPGTGKLIIMNANGVIIETRNISVSANAQTMNFDLSKHGKGVYFIHVVTAEGDQVQKIIIY